VEQTHGADSNPGSWYARGGEFLSRSVFAVYQSPQFHKMPGRNKNPEQETPLPCRSGVHDAKKDRIG
jgi:hypothetical protein